MDNDGMTIEWVHTADDTTCDEPDLFSPDDDICAHGFKIHQVWV